MRKKTSRLELYYSFSGIWFAAKFEQSKKDHNFVDKFSWSNIHDSRAAGNVLDERYKPSWNKILSYWNETSFK